MSNRVLLNLLLTWPLLGMVATAQADVIRYTLVNVEFEDGGTATGYFDWDTDLPDLAPEFSGASVNYEINVSGGNETDFPPISLTDENSGAAGTGGTINDNRILTFGITYAPPNRQVALIPDPAVGELGVDLNIALYISSGNTFDLATSPAFVVRDIIGGSIEGEVIFVTPVAPAAPVPVDARWALALISLLMLGTGLIATRRSA